MRSVPFVDDARWMAVVAGLILGVVSCSDSGGDDGSQATESTTEMGGGVPSTAESSATEASESPFGEEGEPNSEGTDPEEGGEEGEADAEAPIDEPDAVGGEDAESPDTSEPDIVEEPAVPASWQLCQESADCTLVWNGCCESPCDGDEPFAVRTDYVEDAETSFLRDGLDCTAPICSSIPCPAVAAACVDGQCTVEVAGAGAGGCADFSESDCDLSPLCEPIFGEPLLTACDDDVDGQLVYAGCRDAEAGCLEVETCARDANTFAELLYPDSCIPAGWTACGPDWCANAIAECSGGVAMPLGGICVRGAAVEGGEELLPGAAAIIELAPIGCFPPNCTKVHDAECTSALSADGALTISGLYCLSFIPGQTCGPPCEGNAPATCDTPGLEPGLYTIDTGAAKLSFTVPSILPPGGLCTDSE